MIEMVAQAATFPKLTRHASPYSPKQESKELLVVGGAHLHLLENIFPEYALSVSVLIPSGIPGHQKETEYNRAEKLAQVDRTCRNLGIARDLSGINTDFADFLIVDVETKELRSEYLSQAWRVVKELGKVVVLTNEEFAATYLARYGIAGATHYPAEGFYVGSIRKHSSLYYKT